MAEGDVVDTTALATGATVGAAAVGAVDPAAAVAMVPAVVDPAAAKAPDPTVDPAKATEAETPEAKVAREAAEKKTADEAAAKAPAEKFEDFKAPDGVVLDKAAVERFLPVAKQLGISKTAAQALVEHYAKEVQAAGEGQAANWKATREGWLTEAKTDPVIGGAKFDENLATAKNGLIAFMGVTDAKTGQRVMDPKLVDALNATSAGDHPVFIRLFHALGQAVKDDKFVAGNGIGQVGGEKAALDAIYPSMKDLPIRS